MRFAKLRRGGKLAFQIINLTIKISRYLEKKRDEYDESI